MRTTTYLCTLLASLALLSGCVITTNNPGGGGNGGDGGQGGDGGNGGQGGAGGQGGNGGSGGGVVDHEATCYEPTAAEGTDSFEATYLAPERTFSVTVPNDAGGGILELRGQGAQLFMTVLTDSGPDADIAFATTVDADVAARRIVAAPGMTYLVRLRSSALVESDPPETVTFDWKFTSVVDCFEPNNTPAEAREIALDKPLSTYMLAGYVENAWPSFESQNDYYKIQVDRPGKLRATLSTPIALSLDIYAKDGETNLNGGLITETEPGTIEVEIAEAGTYYVRVAPFVSLRYNDFDTGGETPANWTTPYELTVTHE